jgi:hypothetical protein
MSQAVRPASGLFEEPREVTALGDLFANIWQIAYVTRDLDQGIELLRDELGVEHCTEVPTEGATFLKGDDPAPWDVRIAMGARGGMIVEVIEAIDGEVDFYRQALPEEGPGLGFHHLAALVPTGDEEWERIGGMLAEQGLSYEYTVLIPDRARVAYVDTRPQLGHYVEICQLKAADIEFFSGLVADSA